ncbi:MAG: hypothetical protein HN404_06985 [Gemmatimonadetes bacterium]|nr:hypothetical protein [Gemmatimonadota bacterium]
MSIRDLPLQPSLRHLKQEAKQFHKGLLDGDSTSIERIRAGLPRLTQDAAVDDVTLMEAQHALAREYGFREWPALAAAAELEFDDLSAFSDQDTHCLLQKVDQKDLVISLKLAGDDVKRRMLTGMSDRVRQFITEEMVFLGPMPEEEILQVQERILVQVRGLGRDGTIAWPPGAETPPPRGPEEPDLEQEIADHVQRRLVDLSLEELRVFVHGIAARARTHGILSLEAVARRAADGFVQEALRLATDGTEPALIEDLLKTRIRALLQHLDNRQRVIHEGIVAICGGDNPRLVAHKLVAVYRADFGVDIEPAGASLEALQDQVRANPVSGLDLDQLTRLLTDVSEFTRHEGLAMLAPLVGDVDDELMREGIRMLAEQVDMTTICEEQEPRMYKHLETMRTRLGAFTGGIMAIQQAKKGAELDSAIDQGASK